MNKDEIQPRRYWTNTRMSCGLVMNKDEIQPTNTAAVQANSCGLVMNKDEIQHKIHMKWH